MDHGCMNEWMHGWMHGWMDEWMDGWMNEWSVVTCIWMPHLGYEFHFGGHAWVVFWENEMGFKEPAFTMNIVSVSVLLSII
jgi:hypothetical protein